MNINEEFNPLLLKALTIHSAKYPAAINMGINDRVNQMGFGLPAATDDIIYNDEYEITLILQDTLIKGEYMEILEFPFPESLIDKKVTYGNINLTLVGAPVLRNHMNIVNQILRFFLVHMIILKRETHPYQQ